MLAALAYVVLLVLQMVELLVVGRVIASWLDADRNNFIMRILRETTEPLFKLVKPLASKIPGPLDWSATIILLHIEFVRRLFASVVS
jgi:YggT family protein